MNIFRAMKNTTITVVLATTCPPAAVGYVALQGTAAALRLRRKAKAGSRVDHTADALAAAEKGYHYHEDCTFENLLEVAADLI